MHIRTIDVAGFTYKGDVLCAADTYALARKHMLWLGGTVDPHESVHNLIGEWARREFPELGIWVREEFWTYDTRAYCSMTELPKPFMCDQVEDGETCHDCGVMLGC